MYPLKPTLVSSLLLVSLLGLQACGGDSQPAVGVDVPQAAGDLAAVDGVDTTDPEASVEVDLVDEEVAEGEAIDPQELEPAGDIELKQYTVAWVGSGTMGGGTLTVDGKEYPFRLAGLGLGGYGASSIDATGKVYNLPNIDAFPGTYGNARMGMTGGDSGSGKLWLRNSDDVVIELVSEMRGLALGTGVDGILIQWEDEEDSTVDDAMDTTRDTAGDAIDAGADAIQGGADKVKGWFKKEDD